jgi:hypothetical protein
LPLLLTLLRPTEYSALFTAYSALFNSILSVLFPFLFFHDFSPRHITTASTNASPLTTYASPLYDHIDDLIFRPPFTSAFGPTHAACRAREKHVPAHSTFPRPNLSSTVGHKNLPCSSVIYTSVFDNTADAPRLTLYTSNRGPGSDESEKSSTRTAGTTAKRFRYTEYSDWH